MAKIPEPNHSTAALIDAHFESSEQENREHLGCSLLGHYCERWLWLSFRWFVREEFPGRILRLFRRGQNEEAIVVRDLRAIGCSITDQMSDGSQWRVDFGNHVSGSLDGLITDGLPEAPSKKHILEIKTHSKKSFDELEKKGVKSSKPMHWAQMQVYMLGTGIDRALYAAVCKDDDRYYFERVRFEHDNATALVERGHRVVSSDRLPPPISTDPTWYQCRFCPAHALCHKSEPIQQTNCRTCGWSTAMPDSTFKCEKHGATIPATEQKKQHDCYELHDDVADLIAKG
jgi:hypothetical protein